MKKYEIWITRHLEQDCMVEVIADNEEQACNIADKLNLDGQAWETVIDNTNPARLISPIGECNVWLLNEERSHPTFPETAPNTRKAK